MNTINHSYVSHDILLCICLCETLRLYKKNGKKDRNRDMRIERNVLLTGDRIIYVIQLGN